MRRMIVSCFAVMAGAAALGANSALAQMMPGGGGQMPGRPSGAIHRPFR